ncbi:hypothetical protein [Lentibacillus salicampi]|uniref:Uncharacterized protein n=1 Tax=Lentibacillus salicampi TaxID=175306 RepID=A0A4Y9AER3_9BACI|nr:hypothetical protein [Lentibacillus salicampi]TFJ94313.1 hypothetical protein E4U82_03395 [Lentibacillus salicampi]
MPNLHYYVTGNTAEGLVNQLDTNLHNISRIIALQHPSAALKTTIINQLAEQYRNNHLEILESALGNDYLDGIIIREKSLAVIDEKVATTSTETIDLTAAFPAEEQDQTKINRHTQQAYDSFVEGLKIHDDLEAIYIDQMDFEHADAFAEQFIHDLLQNIPSKSRRPHTYTRLFGTNTADGVVNVVPHLIKDLKNVHFIKGRAGTGKSVFMKKIADACADHGFDVELYYCSFDPNSVDMVLVRELDFCIFDSTDPHEFFPEKDGDVTVDLYKEFVVPGTDEKYAAEIHDAHTRYKSCMKKGVQWLKEAGNLRQEIENYYMESISKEAVSQYVKSIPTV